MKYPTKWESMSRLVSRLKVPGGWLVKAWDSDETGIGISICFFPDQNYSWELEKDV